MGNRSPGQFRKDKMKTNTAAKDLLFYERFKKNWRLKIGPRTWPVSFRPGVGARKTGEVWKPQAQILVEHR
jgi:hypothetical protein